MEATSPTSPAPTPVPPPRAARRPRDMALSMVVLLVPVFLFVLIYRFFGHETPPTYDTASAYDAARTANLYPVLIPGTLPKHWYITSATYAAGELRLTVDTPGGGGALFVESNADPATLVPTEIGTSAHLAGTVEINGLQWQRLVGGRPGEQALVETDAKRTIIIDGRATEAEQRTLAASLH